MLDLAAAYGAHCSAKGEFAQHPATWINADGWLDSAFGAVVIDEAATAAEKRKRFIRFVRAGIQAGLERPTPQDCADFVTTGDVTLAQAAKYSSCGEGEFTERWMPPTVPFRGAPGISAVVGQSGLDIPEFLNRTKRSVA